MCGQEVRVNLEDDPVLEFGNRVQCPNCGYEYIVSEDAGTGEA